jgi:hypothetical protein
MKKSILLLAGLILLGLNSIAQDTYNLVIFSEDGDGFFAYVNGIRQNDKAETNVKITGLNSQALSVRLEFEDKALPKLKQNMMPEAGFEHTVRIKKNMKKEMKMQYFGRVALADAPQSSASTVAYHTSENTMSSSSSSGNIAGDGTSVITTSTTTKVNSNPNNVSVTINAGGTGISTNIDGMNQGNGSMSSTSSTTVNNTTSSSTSSSSGGTVKSTKSEAAAQPLSNGGCNTVMTAGNFEKMKQSVESKPFSDTKMSTAKIATKNACLSTTQIKAICALFSMDDEKLAYAKYAYNYCIDKGNYYQVSEIFSFSATTEELNKFLEQN